MNNRKFKTWELLVVCWAALSGLAYLLKLWDSPLAIVIDAPWFRLNHVVSFGAFLVMMHLRGRREKLEAEQLP